jgi:hypothetical protein
MQYTNIILFALAIFGVFLHNLVKLNNINKRNSGNINLGQYIKIERFAIMISVCVALIAVMVKSEVKQLEVAGKWLGISFLAIGYMAQSILATVMGKAEKFIQSQDEPKPPYSAPNDSTVNNKP